MATASMIAVAGRNYYGGANALLVSSGADGARIKQSIILTEDPAPAVVRLLSLRIGGVAHLYCLTDDGTRLLGVAAGRASALPEPDGRARRGGRRHRRRRTGHARRRQRGRTPAFDIASGSPSWSYPIGNVNDLALAQLDGDA
jgi:hypothetical protein